MSIKAKAAKIVEPEQKKSDRPEVALPPGIPEGARVVASGINNPTVKFENPGDFVAGKFVQSRQMTLRDKKSGKERQSMLYDLELVESPRTIVSVWGSGILDRRMRESAPKPGQSVMIQYVGDVPSTHPSDAHDFVVAVW